MNMHRHLLGSTVALLLGSLQCHRSFDRRCGIFTVVIIVIIVVVFTLLVLINLARSFFRSGAGGQMSCPERMRPPLHDRRGIDCKAAQQHREDKYQ